MTMRRIIAGLILFAASVCGVQAPAQPGSSAKLQISPDPVNFPSTFVNDNSSAGITITNTGTADVTIRRVKIHIYNGAMGISADGCKGFTLGPGLSCQVEVGFQPDHYGPFVNFLFIYEDGSDVPQHVRLQGCGHSETVSCNGN
jgi:hypothetical protein